MAKDLKSLLSGGDPALTTLAKRANAMQSLHQSIAESLPRELGEAIVAASLSPENVLTVVSENPAWASRLRFVSGEMLEAARRAGVPAVSCRVRVRPQA